MEWRVNKYSHVAQTRPSEARDSWTCVSDIGRSFGGVVLAAEDYLRIEKMHIDLIEAFLNEARVGTLRVRGLEKSGTAEQHRDAINRVGLSFCRSSWDRVKEGVAVVRGQILEVCLLALRKTLWCRLEHEDGFFVHFGHDYYVYVGSAYSCPKSVEFGHALGLNVDEFLSPYHDDDSIASITRAKPGSTPTQSGLVDATHRGVLAKDKALRAAFVQLGHLGDDTEVILDDRTGTLLGEQTRNGERGWSLEADHIYWWDWREGAKDEGGRYGHEYFEVMR